MNSVNIVGRLTKDPEIRRTEKGSVVANFSVAINRHFKNADGGYDADFINCVAWEKSAEFLEKYFKKGDAIGITGRIQTRKWVTDDGQNRTAFEVVADRVHFVESKKDRADAGHAPARADDFEEVIGDDEELPF
jgi:single-strand DNA-binding protein